MGQRLVPPPMHTHVWEVTVGEVVTEGRHRIPRRLGEGEIRKPAALQRKKTNKLVDGL